MSDTIPASASLSVLTGSTDANPVGALSWHQDGTLCLPGHRDDGLTGLACGPLFDSVYAAAVYRVRALHARQDKPVRSYSPDGYCGTHKPDGRPGPVGPSFYAAIRDCPDCHYTEYFVCSHCECPNDEWPCPTIRAQGDVFA